MRAMETWGSSKRAGDMSPNSRQLPDVEHVLGLIRIIQGKEQRELIFGITNYLELLDYDEEDTSVQQIVGKLVLVEKSCFG